MQRKDAPRSTQLMAEGLRNRDQCRIMNISLPVEGGCCFSCIAYTCIVLTTPIACMQRYNWTAYAGERWHAITHDTEANLHTGWHKRFSL